MMALLGRQRSEYARDGLLSPAERKRARHQGRTRGGLLGNFGANDVAEIVMGVLPGSGDVMAARDSGRYGRDMLDSIAAGDYGKAASDGLMSLVAGAGALPMVPYLAGLGTKAAKALPMDHASRMEREISNRFRTAQRNAALPIERGGLGLPAKNTAADRAAALGYDTDVYHATKSKDQFDKFKPGMWDSTYLAASPKRAEIGASAGSQELANLSAAGSNSEPSVRAIMPLLVRGDDIATLRPSKMIWAELPEYADESDVSELSRKVGGAYWWDVYDEIQVKPPKWDKDDNLIDPGKFKYKKRPYPAQAYTADAKPWQDSQPILAGYNSGSDAKRLNDIVHGGQHAFLVSDEAGASIVANPKTMLIRSRFAAFDPAKRNSTDIMAGLAPLALLGAGAYAMPDQENME